MFITRCKSVPAGTDYGVGGQVCQAGDCRAALKQLELQSPDVALCDVFLPDGNGVDLVLAIKKAAPNVEVIPRTTAIFPMAYKPSRTELSTYITKGRDNKIIPLIKSCGRQVQWTVRLKKLQKKVRQVEFF